MLHGVLQWWIDCLISHQNIPIEDKVRGVIRIHDGTWAKEGTLNEYYDAYRASSHGSKSEESLNSFARKLRSVLPGSNEKARQMRNGERYFYLLTPTPEECAVAFQAKYPSIPLGPLLDYNMYEHHHHTAPIFNRSADIVLDEISRMSGADVSHMYHGIVELMRQKNILPTDAAPPASSSSTHPHSKQPDAPSSPEAPIDSMIAELMASLDDDHDLYRESLIGGQAITDDDLLADIVDFDVIPTQNKRKRCDYVDDEAPEDNNSGEDENMSD